VPSVKVELGEAVEIANGSLQPTAKSLIMKRMISLLLAALIVGFIIFAIAFWLIRLPVERAIGIGVAGTVGGIAGEYFGYYMKKRKIKRNSLSK
jgi:membrane associated rhomboid family serine protease